MQRMLLGFCLLASWSLATGADSAQAEDAERIISFHSDISVRKDSSMVVVESIEAYAGGRQIKRGIFRDFPTRYQDRFGNEVRVQFSVAEVLRDGRPEQWHQATRPNGVRVYVGREGHVLEPGQYQYQIRYTTDRQLGYFDDFDELYWNVTGNGWNFPIGKASASVRLPDGILSSEIKVTGYTGLFGENGNDYRSRADASGVFIETTQPLSRRAGMTISVIWPKGHVAEPSQVDRLGYLLADNRSLLLALTAFLVSAVYLIWIWRKVGRDPEPGIIFPHYSAPEGHSPASAHYVSKMTYNSKTFSAALISLAVKGHLKIVETTLGFRIEKLPSDQAIAPGEAVLLAEIFKTDKGLYLLDDNYEVVRAAQDAHAKELEARYKSIFFNTNSKWLLASGAVSLTAVVTVAVWGGVTPFVLAAFFANGLMHIFFQYLLKAPTDQGRKLLDQLDGFELYLSVAEKVDLEIAHPPEKTPELFERFLPYALALGVENAWADQFSSVFDSLGDQDGYPYRPGWYVGSAPINSLASFSKDLGRGLSSAVSSSANPPGSNSGSGGGGFSGGGGGGGGGGGW